MWKIWCFVLGLFSLLPAAAFAQASPERPAIRIAAEGVSATGLSPGGPIFWFSVWRQVDEEYAVRYARRETLDGANRDGTASFPFAGEKPPLQAIWGVVDLTTGFYALGAPDGFPLRRVAPQSEASRLPEGQSDQLLDHRAFLLGFLVRAGAGGGAWGFTGGDGGSIDEDRASNGRLVIALDRLQPIGTSPAAPAKLADGDLWFIADPYQMSISVQRGGIAQ